MANVQRNYEEQAKMFCDAIKTFAENPYGLENLELYLSIHFKPWLEKYASTPWDMATEMREFASIKR